MHWFDDWANALQQAWRSLKRTPGFVAIAVGMLALALGLATAVVAEVESLLHPYVGTPYADRIYYLSLQRYSGNRRFPDVTPAMALPALRRAPGVEAASAYRGGYAPSVRSIGGDVSVTSDIFDLLGVQPVLGRVFTADETAESGVAIVSSRVWRTMFNDRPTLDTATLRLGSLRYRVVGVLPPGRILADLVVPMSPASISAAPIYVVGYMVRMKAGTTDAEAERTLAAVAAELGARAGGGDNRVQARVQPNRPEPIHLSELHYALIGAALFILLIACANTSALMLARSVARRRDQAVRIALGAGRRALLRPIVAEVAILGVLGGVAGIIVAEWAMNILVSQLPMTAGFIEPRWSLRVFAILFGVVVGAVAVAAALPAWYVAHIQPAEPIKDRSSGTTSRPSRRFQFLIVGELALAMSLLLGTALMSKSITKVASFDFGYDPRGLVKIDLGSRVVSATAPPGLSSANSRPTVPQATVDAAINKVRELPGVRGAAWVAPFSPEKGVLVSDATVALDTAMYNPVMFNVGPGFTQTLGLAILEGRDFVEGDRYDQGAVIVDERAAASLFPDGRVIGNMVKLGVERSDAPWSRVVGLVPHALHSLPRVAELVQVRPDPAVYVSRQSATGLYPSIVVRFDPARPRTTNDVIDALVPLMPPGASIVPNDWIPNYETELSTRRIAARIFSTLSIASLILSIAGLFGVLSYIVGQRMRDFAIRTALGATRTHIVGHVARDAFVMALGGTAIGAFVGFGTAFAVYEWLWGVYPIDAPSLLIAEAILLGSAVVAAIVPAIRGTRADPVEVMRAV